jgi:hypothetical protein
MFNNPWCFEDQLTKKIKPKIKSKGKHNLVQSKEQFTDAHFDDLLELGLSDLDRKFIEYIRKRKNEPITPRKWTKAGFHEKGRINSINNICRKEGLWIRFGMYGGRTAEGWSDCQHQFYLVKEREQKVRK